MALGREDFVRASRGEPIDIPLNMYGPPEDRDGTWPDDPEVRRAVDWFKSFMDPGDWAKRRDAAMVRLHCAAMGIPLPGAKGRFFDEADSFGWYLFQADAFLDHIWNYEPMFGSRVVPVFQAIGRNLETLRSAVGIDDRVRRMIRSERQQPNGTLFELLVAAAYVRAGASVSFRKETPGVGRSHDLDVVLGGEAYAVECKRMEVGQYGEAERERMRQLWMPASTKIARRGLSAFGSVDFKIELADVSDTYLADKVADWMTGGRPSLLWDDDVSSGVVGELDLGPLQEVLEDNDVLTAGTRLHELLSGRYVRHGNYLQITRHQVGMSPRWMGECDQAVLLRWQSSSVRAINAKARDVLRIVAKANDQLPDGVHGIVHVGFEAVEGDDVEAARFERIQRSLEAFDPKERPLRLVCCHYFVPESPPEGGWAFDETVQWHRVSGDLARPLENPFLVLPPGAPGRHGPHWLK